MDEEKRVSRGQTGSGPVLRGGAFNNNARNMRCAYRNRNNPNNRNNNVGFRVVLAHGFPILPEMPGAPSCGVPGRGPEESAGRGAGSGGSLQLVRP